MRPELPSSTTGSRTAENLFWRWTKSTTLFFGRCQDEICQSLMAETNGLSVVLPQNLWIGPFLWQRGLLGFASRRNRDCFSRGLEVPFPWTALCCSVVSHHWMDMVFRAQHALKTQVAFLQMLLAHLDIQRRRCYHLRALNLDALAVYNSSSDQKKQGFAFVGRVLEEKTG